MLPAMHVRQTILLLLLLLGVAFVAGLEKMRRVEEQKLGAVVGESRKAWISSVKAFWMQQGARLEIMARDRSNGVEHVQKILENDTNWAAETWDERTIASFSADVVWVYRKDGSLFYAKAVTRKSELSALPVPVVAIEKLFGRDQAPHFYFPLADDSDGLNMVEVRGMPVRPGGNADSKQPAEAYFFAGRILNDNRLRESMPPGDNEVSIQPVGAKSSSATETSQMRYALPCRDWQGRDLAMLVFTNENKALSDLESRGDRVFLIMLAGAVVLFILLYLLLCRAVVRPLRLTIDALHNEDVSKLKPLLHQTAEFGELARLIRDYFEQQMNLTREMLERIGTERALRESEEMLRHSQKMEAVGRLAGGVAHDFNNLLTAIIGYANLLRQRFAQDPAARQHADLIHQAGDQAAGLTRQLLAFSRKQLLQPKVIDLNTIVDNLNRLLQRIIGEHIEIRTALEAAPACVKADPGQIEQVIVNLGVNARDAMPRGGLLTIRTVNIELGDADRTEDVAAGAYVAIEVTDTGEGMDEETKKRIFEPFFTTKGPGKGTGLGLATVYGIVRQSRGGIVVESELGRGSTFRILLPRVDAPAELTESAPVVAARSAGAETILVVEDEEIVRELVCEILRGHGYRVLATDRGTEAERLARAENGRIDLLISDVVMPGMNGGEVARRVCELAPRARVLFVSGYSENDMADQGLGALEFQVLQKPFTPATLAGKVREVLDGAGRMKDEG